MTRFRCSSHVLKIEMGRQNGMLLEDRLCAFCENNGIVVIEDEYHFLLHCPRYNTIKGKILKKKHVVLYKVISYSNLIGIMTVKNVDLIQDLTYYVYYSFELKSTPAVVCNVIFNEISTIWNVLCTHKHTMLLILYVVYNGPAALILLEWRLLLGMVCIRLLSTWHFHGRSIYYVLRMCYSCCNI